MVGICELCHSSTICDDCKGRIKRATVCPRPDAGKCQYTRRMPKTIVKGSRDFWKRKVRYE